MSLRPRTVLVILALLILISMLSYSYIALSAAVNRLTAATTTSVKDTGLADELFASFRKWVKVNRGVAVDVDYVAVGTGAAIRMAERGDIDFILVHAPSVERLEVEKNILSCRVPIAYNFFILVGPMDDPAQISGTELSQAFARLYESGTRGVAMFVSRGDDSGTHQKERSLWALAGVNYTDLVKRFSGAWYLETGKGMGDTLLVASEKRAYTLTDIGTWLAFRDKLPTFRAIISRSVEGINVYSVLIPHPEVFPRVKFELSRLFEEFATSPEGQSVIAQFGQRQYGEPLFVPFSKLDFSSPETDPIVKWIKANAVFHSDCPPTRKPLVVSSGGLTIFLSNSELAELLSTALRSVYVSSAAISLAAFWSIPAAIGLAFGSFRYREGIEVGFQALTGVPTVVLGLLFYLLFVRSGPLGASGILYTTEAMVIASSVLVTPILVSLITATLKSAGREIHEAALTVGASRFRAGWEVLHELRVPIAVVVLVAFTRAIGELGVAFMVGGDIRFSTRVLSTAIAFETARGNWEVALLFSGILLVIVLAGSIISVRLVRHGIRRRTA